MNLILEFHSIARFDLKSQIFGFAAMSQNATFHRTKIKIHLGVHNIYIHILIPVQMIRISEFENIFNKRKFESLMIQKNNLE